MVLLLQFESLDIYNVARPSLVLSCGSETHRPLMPYMYLQDCCLLVVSATIGFELRLNDCYKQSSAENQAVDLPTPRHLRSER